MHYVKGITVYKAIIDCARCGEAKHESEFPQYNGKRSGRVCNKCKASDSKKWYSNNTDRANRNNRNGYYLRHYGMTSDQVEQMEKDSPNCAICGVSFNKATRHVDHCHTTGKVRGLLCTNCNRGLGYFKDNQQSLLNAIAYLQKG